MSAAQPQAAPEAARRVWEIQRIDDTRGFRNELGDHAAVYDASGTLHMVYGGDHLYYARCASATCSVEIVDHSEYVGLFASLALDSQGHPHIAYYDFGRDDSCNDEKVKYAAWTGSQWLIQVVDESCLGKYPSIALDGSDVPHISYFDEVSDDLQLADWDGSYWNSYTPYWLPSLSYSGKPSSLLADAEGNLHLAFIGGSSGVSRVWYNKKVGDNWGTPVEVDPQPSATGLSMALDSTGNPHLSYHHIHDAGGGNYVNKVRYTAFNGSSWLPPVDVADMDYLGQTSVMLGPGSQPRLAYSADSGIATVAKVGSVWGAPTAVPGTTGAERIFLAQAATNVLGLTYMAEGALQNRRNDLSQNIWSAPLVLDNTGWMGSLIAMAQSPSGAVHVVYMDDQLEQLRYAHREPGGAWQVATLLTTAANYYIHALDIALDGGGYPHIVYQEYFFVDQQSTLELINWTGSAWNSWGAVSQPGHNGCDPSLAVNTAGAVFIAYNDCDYAHGNLVLAKWNGSWSYQTVDPASNTIHPSLVVNSAGHMYVSYYAYDAFSNKGTLRYAKKEDTVGWVIGNVTPALLTNTSLAFDSYGRPHIAYAVDGDPDYTVSLASWDSQQWITGTVTTTSYWSEAQLLIDAQNRPHVAFQCWSNPCYAVKDGGSWAITDPVDRPPADPDYSFVQTSSIAIGLSSSGLPLIVYDSEQDVKIAELLEYKLLFLPMLSR